MGPLVFGSYLSDSFVNPRWGGFTFFAMSWSWMEHGYRATCSAPEGSNALAVWAGSHTPCQGLSLYRHSENHTLNCKCGWRLLIITT